jgi:hypothetical protein
VVKSKRWANYYFTKAYELGNEMAKKELLKKTKKD